MWHKTTFNTTRSHRGCMSEKPHVDLASNAFPRCACNGIARTNDNRLSYKQTHTCKCCTASEITSSQFFILYTLYLLGANSFKSACAVPNKQYGILPQTSRQMKA